MSFTATVENGTIKLPTGVNLPDGTKVTIEPDAAPRQPESPAAHSHRHEWMRKFIGAAKDLPADFAAEHDHYIHGTPKRDAR